MIFSHLLYRISMLYLLAFLVFFLRLIDKKIYVAAWVIGCFSLTELLDWVNFYSFVAGRADVQICTTLLEIIIVQLTALCISKTHDLRALFVGITASTYVLAGNVVGLILYDRFYFMPLAVVAMVTVHSSILAFLCWRVRPGLLRIQADETMTPIWRFLVGIPALFYIVCYTLTTWPGNLYDSPTNSLTALLLILLMLMCYGMMSLLLQQQRGSFELRRDNDALEGYAEMLRRETESLRNAEQRSAIFRHDTRHRARIMMSYLNAGDLDSLRHAFAELDQNLDTFKSRHYCSNVAVDGVLSWCSALARNLKVSLVVQVDLPEQLQVNEFEFATVLSNLTENAIYAAAEESPNIARNVTVSIRPIREQTLLEVTNTFTGVCTISPLTGLPQSHHGEGHGYGMRSVSAFAKKYNSVLDYSTAESTFCARMLLDL